MDAGWKVVAARVASRSSSVSSYQGLMTGSPSRGYTAVPTSPPGATRLLGLARANAIAVVPETTHTVVAGETLHCLLLDA